MTTDITIMEPELIYSIAMDLLVGKSSKHHQDLLSQGLINDSFGMDITIEQDYAFLLSGSNTQKPTEFLDALHFIIRETIEAGIDISHFERTKKQIVGGFIHALNSLEYIANQFTKYHFMNGSLFEVLDVAKTVTVDDVMNALKLL